jgi:hypothetical protein
LTPVDTVQREPVSPRLWPVFRAISAGARPHHTAPARAVIGPADRPCLRMLHDARVGGAIRQNDGSKSVDMHAAAAAL